MWQEDKLLSRHGWRGSRSLLPNIPLPIYTSLTNNARPVTVNNATTNVTILYNHFNHLGAAAVAVLPGLGGCPATTTGDFDT